MSPLTFDTWVELGLKGAVVLLTAAVAATGLFDELVPLDARLVKPVLQPAGLPVR